METAIISVFPGVKARCGQEESRDEMKSQRKNRVDITPSTEKIKYAFGWPNWPEKECEEARDLACRVLDNNWDAETIKARGVDHKALRSAAIGFLYASVRYANRVLDEQDHLTGEDVMDAVLDLKGAVNYIYPFLLITGDVARYHSLREARLNEVGNKEVEAYQLALPFAPEVGRWEEDEDLEDSEEDDDT